ncbi:MAG: hypothetical protein M5T61_18615 [Acidimicrobiia bacterium]|nr:hypothetical protein [Acidimicrobiia bacterium]
MISIVSSGVRFSIVPTIFHSWPPTTHNPSCPPGPGATVAPSISAREEQLDVGTDLEASCVAAGDVERRSVVLGDRSGDHYAEVDRARAQRPARQLVGDGLTRRDRVVELDVAGVTGHRVVGGRADPSSRGT